MRLQLGHGGVVFLFDILSSEWYYRPNKYCHWRRWHDLVVVIVVESKNMQCYGSNSAVKASYYDVLDMVKVKSNW